MTGETHMISEARIKLDTITDPIEQVLARKAILQADILSLNLANPMMAEVKPIEFEIIRAFPTTAEIDWTSPSGKLDIKRGQTYLDFHIPSSDKKITRTAANKDYADMAEYLLGRPDINFVMGVTYSIMARLAKRNQGFNIEEISLPRDVMNFASAVWQSMVPNKQFTSAHIVWQAREDFINNPRFNSVSE